MLDKLDTASKQERKSLKSLIKRMLRQQQNRIHHIRKMKPVRITGGSK